MFQEDWAQYIVKIHMSLTNFDVIVVHVFNDSLPVPYAFLFWKAISFFLTFRSLNTLALESDNWVFVLCGAGYPLTQLWLWDDKVSTLHDIHFVWKPEIFRPICVFAEILK